MTPRTPRRSKLSLVVASMYSAALADLVTRQSRFALVRQPDRSFMTWLQSAPPSVGHFTVLHARIGDRLVGWVLTRVFARDGIRIGELLEIFLEDGSRDYYRDLIAAASVTFRGFDPDMLLTTTTCPLTAEALRELRFRRDGQNSVFLWWGKEPAPEGSVLIDGAIADHAFFPVPSGKEASWLETS